MDIVKSTLKWSCDVIIETDNRYLLLLKQAYECLDVDGLLSTIDEMIKWKSYRKEVIHSLMNKNMDSLDADIAGKIEEGMAMARFMDDQVKILKKKNKIRRYLEL